MNFNEIEKLFDDIWLVFGRFWAFVDWIQIILYVSHDVDEKKERWNSDGQQASDKSAHVTRYPEFDERGNGVSGWIFPIKWIPLYEMDRVSDGRQHK